MDLFIKHVKIIDPRSKYHEQHVNILIEKGKITKIGKSVKSGGTKKIWDFDNGHCSIGWLDIGTYIGEPGFEQRDTTASTIASAIEGGYTAIAPFPNTFPVIHSKSEVQFLQHSFASSLLDCLPIGAISKHTDAKEIAEFEDMYTSGAVAFSDGHKSIQNGGLLNLALQYSKRSGAPIIHQAMDYLLQHGGIIHEGEVSTSIGTRGIPDLAETSMIARDTALAGYAEARLLVHCVSSAEGLKLVKEAGKKNKSIRCSVAYQNLIENDSIVAEFNENFKVMPPLRTEKDRKTLVKGLINKDIHVISSNHRPVEKERKDLEFDQSDFGALGLQTLFGCLMSNSALSKNLTQVVEGISIAPYEALRLDAPEIKVGERANLTIFDPNMTWNFDKKYNRSQSENSPYFGKNLIGKPLGVINNNKCHQTEA